MRILMPRRLRLRLRRSSPMNCFGLFRRGMSSRWKYYLIEVSMFRSMIIRDGRHSFEQVRFPGITFYPFVRSLNFTIIAYTFVWRSITTFKLQYMLHSAIILASLLTLNTRQGSAAKP